MAANNEWSCKTCTFSNILSEDPRCKMCGYLDPILVKRPEKLIKRQEEDRKRELQEKDNLDQLVKSICLEKRKYSLNVPIFIKIDPDLSDSSLKDIADIVLGSNINGVIISNTSIKRSNKLVSKYALEKGGISGKPLLEISNEVLRKFYILTNGKVPLIGVGGISSGKDVYEKILNGASLVQMYTALVYYGPGIIKKIKDELIFLLKKDKYKSISSAVGKLNK